MSTETVNTNLTRDGALDSEGTEVVTVDQATGAELARYRVAGAAEARAATAAARASASPWQELSFAERARHLRAWRREIAAGGNKVAALIHAENGKPLEDARAEVLALLEHLRFVIDNAERVLGARTIQVPATAANQRAWIEHLPYGVVGVIGPWNFPLATPGAIVIHAIAAGNAVVLKPSHITPGVGRWLVGTWQRAVPEHHAILQDLIGFARTGQALIAAGVDKVAFTGSVRSGRAVAAQCADTVTPMLLELGGKDPAIVAEDADLDAAADSVVWGALQNAGLGCISLEVAYVVESVYDDFVDKVTALARAVRAGSGPDAQIGPVPLATQIPVIRHHIADALERGASATVGGMETTTGDRFVQPTILVDVPPNALAATEETFGPTLSIVKVADTDEAVALANAGTYGLGGSVYSRGRGEQIARRLRTGMTSINDALMTSMISALPFGGCGDSGYGRKHGDEGLREFAFPHAFTTRTDAPQVPFASFERPAGAVTAAFEALRKRILTEEA